MKLGGMDEKLFPAYWEDLDLCYRALKRGFRLIWEPSAKVVHEHETTYSKMPKKYFQRMKERNQLLLIWKNLTSSSLFRKHLVGLVRRILKGPGYIRIVFMALGKLKDVIRLRNKEIKETWVSDEAIFASFTK
ncbi:MAG: Glycosyl transferase, family 2 [Candidatus Woesebacteria bacterium GW2011_GWB1_41_10]|uniref:Glycosyl transferase, family 2 n=1 Tax=Candidatus Woesebacteria bacterium GW2011_GWB1_41_10 TaxID=1618577 RepID=A0A0G0WK56_9BACT|nr:MAG: Glycosyl transferase, family 2 [Candidatus Woesebacteria bacterium GW2011_GWB1_41_10]